MSAATLPLSCRYHGRAFASLGPWMVRLAVALPLLTGIWIMFSATADTEYALYRLFGEVLPLAAAIAVTLALWPEYRSGAARSLATAPGGAAFRWMFGRALLASAAVCLLIGIGCLIGYGLSLSVAGSQWPTVLYWYWPAGLLFTVSLTLLGTLLFRNPLGGLAVAVVYWLLDAKLGKLGNPLLSLRLFPGGAEDLPGMTPGYGLGVLTLCAVSALIFFVCAARTSALGQSPDRRRFPALLAGCGAVALIAIVLQASVGVGWSYFMRGPKSTASHLRTLQRRSAAYAPLPVSLLFGPVYHGLVALPASGRQSGSEASPRIAALDRMVRRWGAWPFADTAMWELARARTELDGVSGINDYWRLATRNPGSPYAPAALAAIVKTEKAQLNSPATLAGLGGRFLDLQVPHDLRLAAARRLAERYPDSPDRAAAAGFLRQYYPALVRPATMAGLADAAAAQTTGLERVAWLVQSAEARAVLGQPEEARRTADRARQELQPQYDPNSPASLDLASRIEAVLESLALGGD